jgi:hypothetical protein
MDNLLPQFQSAGDYGWRIQLNNSPERTPPSKRYHQTSNNNVYMNNERRRGESKFSKQQQKQKNGKRRARSSSSSSRRPGTAMQFFRPGSVLRDNVPSLHIRPKSSPNRDDRRRKEQLQLTLKYHDDGEDTVFLTRPPTSPEISQQQQSPPHRFIPTEKFLRGGAATGSNNQRPQSAKSLGQRWRDNKEKKMADLEKGMDIGFHETGTMVTVSNVQESPASCFLSAPSGKMDVLQLSTRTSTTTTTRNLGKKTLVRNIFKGDRIGDIGAEEIEEQHQEGEEEEEEEEGKRNVRKREKRKENGYMFVLGSPKELSHYVIKSSEDMKATTIKWSNCDVTPVQVYWIDYGGQLIPRMKLQPGESYIEASWSTHPWYVQPCSTKNNKVTENNCNDGNDNSIDDIEVPLDENKQGCLVVLSSLNSQSSSGGDCLNVVYNPPTTTTIRNTTNNRKKYLLIPSKLSLSSAPKSTPQGTTRIERHCLQADSHAVGNPIVRGKPPPRGLRPAVVNPNGLNWGDRRAGRRPQSARNSSREAIKILRNRVFSERRVRHSARLIRLRQTEGEPADCTITICPAIAPPTLGSYGRRRRPSSSSSSRRTNSNSSNNIRNFRTQPKHRGISSSSSWK